MINVKNIKCGLVLASAIIANDVSANTLVGKYECFMKEMDIEFSLELYKNKKYKQDIEFIGIEKGNYSSNGKNIKFIPMEYTRGGTKKDVPSAYKRNIVSNNKKELILKNLNSDDQIFCKK